MANDVRDTGLAHILGDLVGDLSDLVSKEISLARAEIADKIQTRLYASGWMAGAGVLGLIAAFFVLEAAVFALAAAGLALYWACLIVAAVLAAAAAGALAYGRAAAQRTLEPTRSIRQISKDIRTAKELLS